MAEKCGFICCVNDVLRNEAQRLKLAKIGTTYGMHKGPFSHAAIGCKGLRIMYKPTTESSWWSSKMPSNVETQDLIIDRIFKDWKSLPVGLRRTADENTVLNFQKICRCFQLYLEDLQEKIPASSFDVEKARLTEAFFLGTMDEPLKADAEAQPVMDCSRIPEFKGILDRLNHEVVLQAAQKRADLQKSLENATFMSLAEDLKQDQIKIAQYISDLDRARANWSVCVAAYKRARRLKGLDRTRLFMATRFDIGILENDENIRDVAKHYSVFKTMSARETPAITTDDTLEAQSFQSTATDPKICARIEHLKTLMQHVDSSNFVSLVQGDVGAAGFLGFAQSDNNGDDDPDSSLYLSAEPEECSVAALSTSDWNPAGGSLACPCQEDRGSAAGWWDVPGRNFVSHRGHSKCARKRQKRCSAHLQVVHFRGFC